MAVPITGKPSCAVFGLTAPTRNNNTHTMKATWSITDYAVNENYGLRATALEIYWTLGIPGTDPKKVKSTNNERTTSSQANLNSFTVGSKTYTRQDFYPCNLKQTLSYVTCTVRTKNDKGLGPVASATRKFTKPVKPTIDNFTYTNNTGTVSTVIRTDAGLGYAERYDTRYKVTIQNTRTGNTWTQYDNSSTSTAINISYDVTDRDLLSYGDYVRSTVSAWARGYAGASDVVTKTFYVSYPYQATIKSIDVSSKNVDGKCTLSIDPNSTTTHPVDRVRLDYLANCEYKTASSIPADAVWTLSNIIDDAECRALAISVADIMPGQGNYTWVRVTSWHADENKFIRYSAYKRVTALETPAPTASDDRIKIISASAGEDGKSIVVQLGWNADGQDDSTGTELTWSDSEDTWKSTDDPKIHQFTWSDGSLVVGQTTYHDSALITIKGLNEGTKYYIKARRYLEGDTISYSDYSNTATSITSEAPEAIVASCDRYVPVDGSLPVSWTFSGNGIQQKWQIISSDGAIIKSGNNSLGSTEIPASRLASFATNNIVSFTVQASTGSGFVSSTSNTVEIVEYPTLALTVDNELTEQPFSFDAAVSTPCDLIAVVTSQGASGQFPDKIRTQTTGDTIWSDIVVPEWGEYSLTEDVAIVSGKTYYTLEDDGTYEPVADPDVSDIATYYEFTYTGEATITLPDGLGFWNGTNYTLSVVATDRRTGLQSTEQTADFIIDWDNPAVEPTGAVTVTYIDQIDVTSGQHRQAAQIDLTPPTGSAQTDVYDIYRMTGGGAYLIGESFPLTYTAYDEYAPFGKDLNLFYRVALRTVDGDIQFTDIYYTAAGDALRLDWSGGSLELPYNIQISDKYSKDVETRKHMNGDIDAYWNQNVEHKGSLNSDVIRLNSQQDIWTARELAQYPGAVFVRTPDGSAYEADVQITDMSVNGPLEAIAIDATEISLTQEFVLPTPYDLEEEEE